MRVFLKTTWFAGNQRWRAGEQDIPDALLPMLPKTAVKVGAGEPMPVPAKKKPMDSRNMGLGVAPADLDPAKPVETARDLDDARAEQAAIEQRAAQAEKFRAALAAEEAEKKAAEEQAEEEPEVSRDTTPSVVEKRGPGRPRKNA